MILEETRENFTMEWGDYVINISHDFYNQKFNKVKYEALYELTGTILLICEGNIAFLNNAHKRKFIYSPKMLIVRNDETIKNI